MNEPWSSYREIGFDVMFDSGGWVYIGYGRVTKYDPDPPSPEPSSSLSRNTDLALKEIK